jgi:hypothetical protein
MRLNMRTSNKFVTQTRESNVVYLITLQIFLIIEYRLSDKHACSIFWRSRVLTSASRQILLSPSNNEAGIAQSEWRLATC